MESEAGGQGGRGDDLFEIIGCPRDVAGQGGAGGGWWGLENWTIFMDVICVSSLKKKRKYFSLSDHQLAENVILVFGLQKRTNIG